MKRIAKPFTVEVKRSRSKEPLDLTPAKPDEPAIVDAAPPEPETAAAKPERQGRILPVLDPPDAVPEAAAMPRPAMPASKPKRQNTVVDPAPATLDHKPEPDALAKGLAIVRRAGRWMKQADGMPREAYRYGERWKHRLPATLQRSPRRRKPV